VKIIKSEIPFKTITLERTECFGSCPSYKVNIDHSGEITYTGNNYVEKLGIHIWEVDQKTIVKIAKALENADYFNLKKLEYEYLISTTDTPFCKTSVELFSGEIRSIAHDLQEQDEWPVQLRRFEKRIDNILGIGYEKF